MAALTIWVLDVDDLEPTIDTCTKLRDAGVVEYHDAASVRWPRDAERPTTAHVPELASDERLDPSFWGLLFGLTFFADELGPGVGPAAERVHHQLASLGIDEPLAETIRQKVQPGRSALFVYSSGSFAESPERMERAKPFLKGLEAELIRTNLDTDQSARITTIFGVRGGIPVALPAPTAGPAPAADPTAAAQTPAQDSGPAFDLASTYVHLDESAATTMEGGEAFWKGLMSQRGMQSAAVRRGGWLVGTYHFGESWSSWEMHPKGDEVVACLSGRHTFHLDDPDGERLVELAAGQTVVVPQGVWHTVTVHDPGDCLHITAGAGTEHRAR